MRVPLLPFAKISQILKTVNACLVTVAPAKVQSVAADDAQIPDFDFVRHSLRPERALSRPFVNALRAGTGPPKHRGFVIANPTVSPGYPQARVALLRNLCRFDRLAFLCCVDHN